MEEKFLCVMVGYDEETEMKLSDIQKELYLLGYSGTHTKNLPQHITLGTYDLQQKDELVLLIKSVAERTTSFNITFNHVGIFSGSKVLFIAPDSSKELLDLKENFGDSFGWTPHTTMLIDEPNIIYEALPIVAEKFKAFKGKVNTIHLYEFWPTRHIFSISLVNGDNLNVR